MRKITLFFFVLFMAMVVKAQTETEYGVVWSQDFENADTYTDGWTGGHLSQKTISNSNYLHVYSGTDMNSCSTEFGEDCFSTDSDYNFEFDWNSGTGSTADKTATFTVLSDNSSTLFKVKVTTTVGCKTAVGTLVNSSDEELLADMEMDGYLKESAFTFMYHFKIEASSEDGVMLTVTKGNETVLEATKISESFCHITALKMGFNKKAECMGIDNIVLSILGASEGVSTPLCSITGTYGDSRTVTIVPGVGTEGTEASGTYYTLDGTDPTAESNLYEAPFTISESCTVKAISYLPDGTASEILEFEAEAGFAWPLNNDIVKITDLVDGDGEVKNPVIGNCYVNTGVLGDPEVSFSYTFNGEEVTLPYTVTEDGTLVATVSADGYASAQETLEVKASYIATRSIDFAAMSQDYFAENYGETWAEIAAGVRLANWSKSYTYYGTTITSNFTFDNFLSCSGSNNYALTMIFESGVGRSTGSTYTIVGGAEGDIAVYEMNESNAPTESYVKYVVPYMEDSKMSRAASASQTVAKVSVYSPARELTVTDGEDLDATGTYTSASYVRKFNTEYTYGTICLPFAPDAETCENYTFYKLMESNSEVLYFEEEAEPKANVAYLYKLNDGVDAESAKTLTGGVTTIAEVETEQVGGWSFIGSFKEETITDLTDGEYFAYIPVYNEKKDVFVKATNSLTVRPYRAYFKFVETQSLNFAPAAAVMFLSIGGEYDGTNEIEKVVSPEEVEGAVFDMEGRSVEKMQEGKIYIVGGQKVIK